MGEAGAVKRILIVEDDDEVRGMIEKLLRGENRDFREAGTGAEALEAIRVQRPDLIVLDFFLPDMVAMGFISESRKICPGVPIVIVSSFWNMKYAGLALRDGAVDFVPKPFDPQQLVETVNFRLAKQGGL